MERGNPTCIASPNQPQESDAPRDAPHVLEVRDGKGRGEQDGSLVLLQHNSRHNLLAFLRKLPRFDKLLR